MYSDDQHVLNMKQKISETMEMMHNEKKCVHRTCMPLLNRKLKSDHNESPTHNTIHHAKAAYQISNHSHHANGWFLRFS